MEAERLPFLVVHGGWFWIVLVAVCSALLLGIVLVSLRAIRLSLARRKRRETLSWLRQHSARELVEGNITLAGHWRGDVIDACGEQIAMGEWRGAWPRDATIRLGETVLVTGELHRGPVAEGGDSADRWWLVGAVAYRDDPEVHLARLRGTTLTVLVATATLVAYVGLRTLGGRLADGQVHGEYLAADGGPLVLTNSQSLSIAASLPGSRDDALETLSRALWLHPYRDDRSVERQRDLARLVDGPCAVTDFLTASGRYDEELDRAHKCGHRQHVFELELAKGDFARAWEDRPPHLDWPFGEGMIAIARADWKSAAEAAERVAKVYDRSTKDHEASLRQYLHTVGDLEQRERMAVGIARDTARRFRCMSKWFGVLGGDRNAAAQLKALDADATFSPLVCAPIVAQLFTGEERAQYLLHKSPDPEREHLEDESMIRMLLWLEGQEDPRFHGIMFTADALAGQEMLDQTGFLLGLGIETWRGKTPRNYILALEGDGLLAVQRGDFDTARKLVREALTAAAQQNDTDESDVRYLAEQFASAVALRAGDAPGPRVGEHEPDGLRVRRGADPRYEMTGFPESCSALLVQARIAAQAGDGRPLATAMQSCKVEWTFSPQILLGLLPLVKQGRPEIATALRWWGDKTSGTREPFVTAMRASLRRDLARMAGDAESAERWGRIASAYAEPLKDPVRRTALVLWSR